MRRGWRVVRGALAALLGTLGVLAATLSIPATWVHTLVHDTDAYVGTLAPLANAPAVQEALTRGASDAALDALDLTGLAASGIDSLGLPSRAQGLAQVLAIAVAEQAEARVEGLVARTIESPGFAAVWREANRLAHAQVVARVTGARGEALAVSEGVVSVELGPVVAAAREALADRGIPGASLIPDTSRSLVLVESSHLAQVQRGLTFLDAVATWLPWLALGLVLAAVASAVRRWRTLAVVAGGAVVAALAVLIALGIAQGVAANASSETEAARAVVNQILAALRTRLWWYTVVAGIVGVCAVVGSTLWRRRGAGEPDGVAEHSEASERAVSVGDEPGEVRGIPEEHGAPAAG